MRIPTVRLFGDCRPIEPWEHRYWWMGAGVVWMFLVAWAVVLLLVLPALVLADVIARAVLPARVRDRYWYRNPDCPACGGRLAVREIPTRSARDGKPMDWVIYEGTCEGCDKGYRWVNLGKVAPVLHEVEARHVLEGVEREESC